MKLRFPHTGSHLYEALCLLFALVSANTASAQTASSSTPPNSPKPAFIDEKSFASPRELEVAADTSRLYRLTVEFREELEKSGTATLPIAAVKKAEEIERLAHRLNEAMKRK